MILPPNSGQFDLNSNSSKLAAFDGLKIGQNLLKINSNLHFSGR
jgi:hypothetical protein